MRVSWSHRCNMRRPVLGFLMLSLFRSISSCSRASYRTWDYPSGRCFHQSRQRRMTRKMVQQHQLRGRLALWLDLVGRMQLGCWFRIASFLGSEGNQLSKRYRLWNRVQQQTRDGRDLEKDIKVKSNHVDDLQANHLNCLNQVLVYVNLFLIFLDLSQPL